MWMAGETYCQQKLYEAACVADLILVEGAMGMFDGEPSSADLAARFKIPIAIILDVKGMAQTAAAIAVGLATFRDDISVAGLIANNCSTDRHRELIEQALPTSLPLLASLKTSEEVALPERHLGLVQASEVADELETRFDAGADWLEASGLSSTLLALKPVDFQYAEKQTEAPLLKGMRIGIAKDAAFSFIYDANVRLLEAMGARVEYFSPIKDVILPDVDSLWLPGGYPELHAGALAKNKQMLNAIKAFHKQDKPILAECGGFLYCLQSLTDLNEQEHTMAGIMPGFGAMRGKRGCQGMQSLPLPEGDVRGHAHHRSRSHQTPEPLAYAKRQRHAANGEAIYRDKNLTASYLHLFFPSNPQAIANLFGAKELSDV
jgi:cobyrinic acid a,c-diamide synthase